jgi:hypothetical protein
MLSSDCHGNCVRRRKEVSAVRPDQHKWIYGAVAGLLIASLVTGCGRTSGSSRSAGPVATTGILAAHPGDYVAVEGTPGVYSGNLNPEKAAEITNAIARLQYEEVSTKDLPKDPKVLMQINDRIRLKSTALYAQYGTTMGDVSRYIRDLSPKDRERFNNRLTELFLAENKKREDRRPIKAPVAPAPPAGSK